MERAGEDDSIPGEKLLTKGEVAQLCRVEIRTVDRWVAAGKIRCYRTPSGRLLFRKSDLLTMTDRWKESGVTKGQSPAASLGNASSSHDFGPARRG